MRTVPEIIIMNSDIFELLFRSHVGSKEREFCKGFVKGFMAFAQSINLDKEYIEVKDEIASLIKFFELYFNSESINKSRVSQKKFVKELIQKIKRKVSII